MYRKLPRSLSLLVNLFLLASLLLTAAGCDRVTPAPTETNTPTSTPTPPPTATPTPMPGINVPLDDSGAPLPPQVIARSPGRGQEVPLGGAFEITFDQAMNPENTADAWQIIGPEGQTVEGALSWPDSRTLRFSPAQPLAPGALYTATLSTVAASESGVPLSEPLSLEFQAVGELQVSQVFPADGASDVTNDAAITVIFNRPVAPLVMAEEQPDLPDPISVDPPVSGVGEWVNTSVYVLRPDKPLRGSTTYTVQIAAGLTDAAGETALASDYSWQFKTVAPSIGYLEMVKSGYINPPYAQFDVPLDETFAVSFLQPMDASATEAAVYFASLNGGETVPFITEWNDDFTRMIITPTQRLALETDYALVIGTGALSADGGTLREGLDWAFRTVLPPAIFYTIPADGEAVVSFYDYFTIYFVSPMDLNSLKDKVIFNPPLEGGGDNWYYSPWNSQLSFFGFKPATTYSVQILPGMADPYGNTINQGQTIRFTSGHLSPSARLNMPYNTAIYRVGGPQEFYASYVNVNAVELKLYRLTEEEYTTLSYPYTPSEASLVWQERITDMGSRDEQMLERLELSDSDGNPLKAGFYYLTMKAPPYCPECRYADTRTIMIANANLTFKTTENEALAWLTDLTTGLPVEGVPVTIFDPYHNAIGSGVTDANGILYLSDLPLPEYPGETRYAYADNGEIFAYADSNWGSGVSSYDFGIWGEYYNRLNRPVAYVYTDRPIYRPGQPVYFKGILRLDDDLTYSLPADSDVRVVIESYDGEQIFNETLPLTEFGSFSGELQLDSEASLGYYAIYVYRQDSVDASGSVSFNVAEYRKPEFMVNVSAEPRKVLGGQEFTAIVEAEYYSGGNVAGAEVYWTLTAEAYSFYPTDKYSMYNFDDFDWDTGYYDYWSGYFYGYGEVIASGQGVTDGNGQLVVTLPASLSDSGMGRTLTFEASVTDLSANTVSGRAGVVAHRSSVYPGVRALSYVGTAGDEATYGVALLDWESNPLAGQTADVSIVERRWNSVQVQEPSGRITWETTVEEIPVYTGTVTTGADGLATVVFTPPNGGVFKARITARDGYGNTATASAYMWVAGEDYIPWRQSNDRSFQLVLDKTTYTPGDTAEVLIASPFQGESYALVTVERGHIRYHEVVRLTNNSTLYRLPITADLAPSAYISVLIVKGVDETNLRPDFRMGMAELKVDTSQQTLSVTLTLDKTTADPGDQVTYNVKVTTLDGAPVSAEVSLALSDLATLSLADPNSPPILDFFYATRGLSVWTAVPIVNDIEDYNAFIEEHLNEGAGMGAGGGKGDDALYGVIEIRQNFPDTAYWTAHLVTDGNGEASVTVTLPDNLTTWRMDARAVTGDTRVGQTTLDIVATKPLLIRPQTPRFFVVGDEATLGAAIHNNSGESFSVEVALQAEGVDLVSDAAQTVEIPAGQQVYVTWNVVVRMDAERVDLVMSAAGGGYSDATRPTMGTLEGQGLPVYRYEVPETVGTSGMILEGGTIVEAISLPKEFTVTQGDLTVKVSPSLAAGMTDGLTYLENYPYECVEQTVSKFLPNVLTTKAMKVAGLSDPALEANLETQVSTALQRLYAWQNSDGGWGWWKSQQSDVLTTAYATLGLIEAQEAGYAVDASVLQRGEDYLRNHLQTFSGLSEPYKLNRQAFVLYVLARGGQNVSSWANQLYDQRQVMALYAHAYLLQTLYLLDSGDPRIATLLSDINTAAIVSATGTHWEEATRDYWNWNTDTRTTAIVLAAVSQIDPENLLNANAVRWLMSNRTDGRWYGTQKTAWTIMALTNWMVASGELNASYEYAIGLNGERVGGGIANADTLRDTYELQLSVADLLAGEINRLAIARSEGEGNLYYTAHMTLDLPVEQVDALDQGIIVSRSYYRLDDRSTPVTEASVGDLLLVRLTVVAPNSLHFVVVDDPLPAGLEAVDQSLNTSQQAVRPEQYDWEDAVYNGWGWWYFDHVEFRDEKVVLSANYLPAGTYVYSYLVRVSSPGTYRVIPPTAQEFYFPEVYGRGDGMLFVVKP